MRLWIEYTTIILVVVVGTTTLNICPLRLVYCIRSKWNTFQYPELLFKYAYQIYSLSIFLHRTSCTKYIHNSGKENPFWIPKMKINFFVLLRNSILLSKTKLIASERNCRHQYQLLIILIYARFNEKVRMRIISFINVVKDYIFATCCYYLLKGLYSKRSDHDWLEALQGIECINGSTFDSYK